MAPKQSKLKKVVRKRKERKLVESGAAHLRSSFNSQMFSALSSLLRGSHRLLLLRDAQPLDLMPDDLRWS